MALLLELFLLGLNVSLRPFNLHIEFELLFGVLRQPQVVLEFLVLGL